MSGERILLVGAGGHAMACIDVIELEGRFVVAGLVGEEREVGSHVLGYAVAMKGTPIYEMVSGAYQVTLVGAFVPLVCGLYWKRATRYGAIASIVLGIMSWVLFLATPLGEQLPAQLVGVLMAGLGMVAGSLLSKPHEHHAHPHNDGAHSHPGQS